MEGIESCFIDGWRKKFEEKEFILYRINLKFENSVKVQIVERRYSEFLTFHNELKDSFDETTNRRLNESFPGKEPLSVQNSNFADKRSRALDAYLQILIYAIKTSELDKFKMNIVNVFLNINNSRDYKETQSQMEPTRKKILLRTPNRLNSEIEKLRHELHLLEDLNDLNFVSELRELCKNVFELQEKGEKTEEDLRCIEKYYELKREWEIRKIRSGVFDGSEFSLNSEKSNDLKTGKKSPDYNKYNEKEKEKEIEISNDRRFESSKRFLLDQEALLSGLAETLLQQKELSKEICSELIEQNRLLGRVDEKQEMLCEGFKGSNDRVRKLQDK